MLMSLKLKYDQKYLKLLETLHRHGNVKSNFESYTFNGDLNTYKCKTH